MSRGTLDVRKQGCPVSKTTCFAVYIGVLGIKNSDINLSMETVPISLFLCRPDYFRVWFRGTFVVQGTWT